MTGISGYVLAGGLSSRMGTDKALLRLGGRTLLEIALAKVRAVCGEAAILCGSAERAAMLGIYGRCVVDRLPECGPLGGVDAALRDAASPRVLIMPVDVPLLPADMLERLASTDTVACFEVDGFVQPLPVALSTAFVADVERALSSGERKLVPLFRQLGLRPIAIENGEAFANVNTPVDFAELQAE